MSVSMLDNIDYRGKKPDNVRSLFDTVAEMVAFSENYLPEVYECNVVEDGNRYRYNVSNADMGDGLGKWRLVENGGSADLTNYYNRTQTDARLDLKVDKVDGMGLSTNDYTTLEKEKLASLENYDDTDVQTHIVNSEQAITDIQGVLGNTPLNTTAQTISDAINEVKTNCDTVTSSVVERVEKNEEDITVLKGDDTVNGSVASKTKTCLIEAQAYTDQKIADMASNQAVVCDEKPSYTDGITTYIKDGISETTDEENIWFYYMADSQLMQTIWINGEEMTIVSAGGVDFEDLVSKSKDVVSTYSGDETDTSKVPDLGAMKSLETKLQTNIDNKIDGDAIYDGVDSTSVMSALSANQGRVLNESLNTKLNKNFSGDNVDNKVLKTDSLGNVVLGAFDDALNNTSSNAVQNTVVTTALEEKFDKVQDVAYAGLLLSVAEDGSITYVDPATATEHGTAETTTYTNMEFPEYSNVDLALDAIFAKLYYVAPTVTLNMTPSTTQYEVGTVIDADTIVFTWTTNKDITSQTLTDCVLADETVRTATYGSSLSSTKTFTLKISDGENSATASKTISFLNKTYWGSAAIPTEYNSAFVLGLSGNKFATSKTGTYSMTVGSGEYGFLAIPTSFGTVNSVWIGGFEVTIENCGAINFTNASGGTTSYTIYKTGQSGLGSINMEVK